MAKKTVNTSEQGDNSNSNSTTVNRSSLVRLARDYETMLQKDFFTGEDMRRIISLVPDMIEYYKNSNSRGVVDVKIPAWEEATKFQTLYRNYELGLIDKNPLADKAVVDKWKSLIQMGRRKTAESYGVYGAEILASYGNITFDFRDYHPWFFLKWAGQYTSKIDAKSQTAKASDYGGQLCIIVGPKGSGKTNFATLAFIDFASREGIQSLGNILLAPGEDVEGYTYVTRESDMYLKSIHNAMQGIPTLGIIDENKLSGLDSSNVNTREGKEDSATEMLTRKIKLSRVRIWQEEKDFASLPLASLRLIIKKYGGTSSLDQAKRSRATFIWYSNGEEESRYDIEGIPSTRIKYMSDDPAPYVIDISITTVYKFLADVLPEARTTKSHLEALATEIVLHKEFYDKYNTRVYDKGDKADKIMEKFRKFRKEHGGEESQELRHDLDKKGHEDGTPTFLYPNPD